MKELCAKYHVSDRMPRCVPAGPLATKKTSYHMELESAPLYKVWAHRKAGWTIDELDCDIVTL